MDQDSKLITEQYMKMMKEDVPFNRGAPHDPERLAPPVAHETADLYDLIYMVRNLETGDDEQTRIDNEDYLNALPPATRARCEEKIQHGDYDGACEDFIRVVAAQHNITAPEIHKGNDGLWDAAHEVWKNLYGDLAEEEPDQWNEEQDIQGWFQMLEDILGK